MIVDSPELASLRCLASAVLTEDSNFLRNFCLPFRPPRSIWPQLLSSAISNGHSLSLLHLVAVWPFKAFSIPVDQLADSSKIWPLIGQAILQRCRMNSDSQPITYQLAGLAPNQQQQFAFLDQLAQILDSHNTNFSSSTKKQNVVIELDVKIDGPAELSRLTTLMRQCGGQLRLYSLNLASVHPAALMAALDDLLVNYWNDNNRLAQTEEKQNHPISVCLTDTDLSTDSLSLENASQLYDRLLSGVDCLDLSRSRLGRKSKTSMKHLLGLSSAAKSLPRSHECNLLHLNLSGNPGLELPTSLANSACFSRLTALRLSGCRLRANSPNLLASLSACRNTLQHLDLSDNPLLIVGLSTQESGSTENAELSVYAKLFNLPHLIGLRLAALTRAYGEVNDHDQIDSRNAFTNLLLAVLKPNGCSNLQRLDISDWPLATGDWANQVVPTLKELAIGRLQILLLSWPIGFQADDWSDGSGDGQAYEGGDGYFQADFDIEARDAYVDGLDGLMAAGCQVVWI